MFNGTRIAITIIMAIVTPPAMAITLYFIFLDEHRAIVLL
jgi:hypothetical protein